MQICNIWNTRKILLSWNSNVPGVLCFYFLNLAAQSLCVFIHPGEWPLILRCKVAFLRAVFSNTPVIRSVVGLVVSRMLLWRFGFRGFGGCLGASVSNKTLTPFSRSALPSHCLREPCSHPALPNNFLPAPLPLFLPKSGGLPASSASIIQELEIWTPEGTPLCLFTQSVGPVELHAIHKQRGRSLTSPCLWIHSFTEFR